MAFSSSSPRSTALSLFGFWLILSPQSSQVQGICKLLGKLGLEFGNVLIIVRWFCSFWSARNEERLCWSGLYEEIKEAIAVNHVFTILRCLSRKCREKYIYKLSFILFFFFFFRRPWYIALFWDTQRRKGQAESEIRVCDVLCSFFF